MEEKIKQIQTYLSTKANPVVQPMLQLMAKERPDNVLPWMQTYINKKMRNPFLLFQRNIRKSKLVILQMMKLMRSNLRRNLSELRRMVAKKSVDRESALKCMENSTSSQPSSLKSSRKALKSNKPSGSSSSVQSFSKTLPKRTCNALSRPHKQMTSTKAKL